MGMIWEKVEIVLGERRVWFWIIKIGVFLRACLDEFESCLQ